MAKSIMQMDWDTCYLCGRNRIAYPCGLEEHHVFGGANRKFSEKYGLKIHIKNSIFRNSLIFQGLPPIKYQNLMYFPLFLPL